MMIFRIFMMIIVDDVHDDYVYDVNTNDVYDAQNLKDYDVYDSIW